MAGSDEDFEMILVANKKLGEENQRLEKLVADYQQRLAKDNELLLRQQKKIEELETELKTITNTFDAREKYTRKLQIENKKINLICDYTKDLLLSIIWLCDHKPDNIQIPTEIQTKCQILQQAIEAKETK